MGIGSKCSFYYNAPVSGLIFRSAREYSCLFIIPGFTRLLEQRVPMKQEINGIPVGISRSQAASILTAKAGVFKPQVQRMVYYPYLWVHYVYTVKTFLGKRSIRAYILVDLLNNIAATADQFDYEAVLVESESLIPIGVEQETAIKTAETYLLHSAVHKMKTLLLPQAEVQKQETLYKPFWIVKCMDRKRRSFRVLVDGVTGKYEILNIDGDDA